MMGIEFSSSSSVASFSGSSNGEPDVPASLTLNYDIFQVLNKDTFLSHSRSAVWRGEHSKTKSPVVVKCFKETVHPKSIRSELKCLQLLSKKPHIIPLIEGCCEHSRVSLVFPFIDFEPFDILYLNPSESLIRQYMKSLFTALHHVHSNNIIHGDVRPENFLFCSKTQSCYLIDFGSARIIGDRDNQMDESARIGANGYKAPEILLNTKDYTSAIDSWSCGVILLSFLSGRYPFFSGSDSNMVSLSEVIALCGLDHTISAANEMGKLINTNLPNTAIPLADLCKRLRIACKRELHISSSGYDLLEKCLTMNPRKRFLSAEASSHPFLS